MKLHTGAFLVGLLVLAALAVADPGKVSGSYLANGREAKLAFVTAAPHAPWEGQAAYYLVLSEKDPGASAAPNLEAMHGNLGDALVISVTERGKVLGMVLCHKAIRNYAFSSNGDLQVRDFSIAPGRLSGRFYVDQPGEFFGDTYNVDLTVTAPLPPAER